MKPKESMVFPVTANKVFFHWLCWVPECQHLVTGLSQEQFLSIPPFFLWIGHTFLFRRSFIFLKTGRFEYYNAVTLESDSPFSPWLLLVESSICSVAFPNDFCKDCLLVWSPVSLLLSQQSASDPADFKCQIWQPFFSKHSPEDVRFVFWCVCLCGCCFFLIKF